MSRLRVNGTKKHGVAFSFWRSKEDAEPVSRKTDGSDHRQIQLSYRARVGTPKKNDFRNPAVDPAPGDTPINKAVNPAAR